MHNRGYTHCDIKAENVLIGKDGYPLLGDLDLTVRQPTISSKQYQTTITTVAPELFLQPSVDKAMDLWALGVLIHYALFRKTPYSPEEIEESKNFIEKCRLT